MEVILIDDVYELGKRGQVVQVADGYGRNYLIPKRLAIPATPGNRKVFEQQRLALAKREAKYKEEAELLAAELNTLHVIISRKTGETGTLFGSVTAKDVGDALESSGYHLDRRKILLNQPIKSIGNYKIEARPHSEVAVELLLSVVPEVGEPLNRVKKMDEESDRIVAELEAKVRELERMTGAAPAPEPPVQPAAETAKKGKGRKSPKKAEVEPSPETGED